MKEFKCCLCGKKVKEYGNNPYPLRARGKCCDKCNMDLVIPARIIAIYSKNGRSQN